MGFAVFYWLFVVNLLKYLQKTIQEKGKGACFFMKVAIGGLSTMIIIILLVNGILAALRTPKKADERTVVLPKLILWIGLICSSFFLVIAVIASVTAKEYIAAIVFLAFALLGGSLMLAYRNCRIFYDKTGFTAKSFFGIQRRYTYDELTGISDSKKDVKLYIGKRRVRIGELSIGKEEFLFFAKKQYRRKNNGRVLPVVRRKNEDSFFNHVEHLGQFIFIYVLILAILFVVLCILIFAFITVDNDDLTYQRMSFSHYEVEEDDLILYSETDTERCKIDDFREVLQNPEDFLAACEAGEPFEVGYIHREPSSGSYNEIESIVRDDGTAILTVETVAKNARQNMVYGLLLFGGLTILIAFSFIMTIRIGRHPERYKKWVIGLFFKDGYIHY